MPLLPQVAIPTAPNEWDAGQLANALRGDAHATFAMTAKRPKWNQRSDSYELPFNGRANFASERNFQLISREGGMGERDRQGLPKSKVRGGSQTNREEGIRLRNQA